MSEMSETVRSSFCTGGECIEVEWDNPMCHVIITQVNESKFTHSMQVTPEEFTAFVRGVKAGEFDRFVDVPSANPAVDLADMSDLELPGMWEKADFMGGDPNERPNDPEDA